MTIIVLIILAGISINLTLGENGIITKSKQAKKETKYTQDMEIIKMAIGVHETEWILEEYPEGEDVFLNELRKTDPNAQVNYDDVPMIEVYYNGDYYTIDSETREERKTAYDDTFVYDGRSNCFKKSNRKLLLWRRSYYIWFRENRDTIHFHGKSSKSYWNAYL